MGTKSNSIEVMIFGRNIEIFGGPYRDRPSDIPGVCMAAELGNLPNDVFIPTADYNVPDVEVLVNGMLDAYDMALTHGRLYVGCWGGIGRTGLFMACFMRAVVPNDLSDLIILALRGTYNKHAVETDEQVEFVHNFPAKRVRRRMLWRFITHRLGLTFLPR